MKSIISIMTLQEVIKKARCNTLVNSGAIEFLETGIIQAKGSGVELVTTAKKGETTVKAPGKVDGSMSFFVKYPAVVQEAGKIVIGNLAHFLSQTEIFEKENQVTVALANNKVILTRELPFLQLDYDLADEKFVNSIWKEQQEVIFGSPVVLKNMKGLAKEFPFTAEVIMDAAQLKAFASMATKIDVKKIPIQVKDGKFISMLKGSSGSSTLSEIKADKITGEASATYSKEVLELFNIGFGLATLRFAENSIIYLHFELGQQTADYICVPVKSGQSVSIPVASIPAPAVPLPISTIQVVASPVTAATI